MGLWINLTETDKATLESILCQSTVEARTYIRAKSGMDSLSYCVRIMHFAEFNII